MTRGTFANIRIKNKMVEKTGGYTKHFPTKKEGEIFDIAQRYKNEEVPLVVLAGKEYGTGSSRDWAAKGTRLLGVKAVIAESFERIHRSNLVGMGVLPLQFVNTKIEDLKLFGAEVFNLGRLSEYLLKPNIKKEIKVDLEDGDKFHIEVLSRIDTDNEIKYFKNDGILPYVLDKI